ncbi:MAG: penicillin-binding transpeptidase domain-containing protein, partial [Candidatus Eremiobacteraeota bacterium]|nr:penicillin-binding transpeptidase domain-containing protein [Candidatus Eremiobacteraeota bacterium]
LAVTPMKMAFATAAIADGGLMMRPQIIKELRPPRRPPLEVPAEPWGRVASAETAATVRRMMLAVVRYGTGTAAALPGIAVAGKTGTGTHPGGPPDAWFVSFAPAGAPRIVVAIVVEDSGYGGTVAAPIARAITAGALALYQR